MRTVVVDPVCLGKMSLPEAFAFAFDPDVSKRAYGSDTSVSDWNEGRRNVQCFLAVNLPNELKRFLRRDTVRISSCQTRIGGGVKDDDGGTADRIAVESMVRMHFWGARLFRTKPTVVLQTRGDGTVWLEGRSDNHAMLPPPLNGIAEACMARHSKENLERYQRCVLESLSRIPTNRALNQ